jgi:FtsZ-binding cell division protein ZapB
MLTQEQELGMNHWLAATTQPKCSRSCSTAQTLMLVMAVTKLQQMYNETIKQYSQRNTSRGNSTRDGQRLDDQHRKFSEQLTALYGTNFATD